VDYSRSDGAELSSADLRGANLREMSLREADWLGNPTPEQT